MVVAAENAWQGCRAGSPGGTPNVRNRSKFLPGSCFGGMASSREESPRRNLCMFPGLNSSAFSDGLKHAER